MVKLDPSMLKYLTQDEFRVLVAIEMGMRNHELVPTPLIERIAGLRHGGVKKMLGTLLKYKLVHHESKPFDGFYLNYPGYDFLALKAFSRRGVLAGVGRQIGVGKESDIYLCCDANERDIVIKLHRLGRTSFRAVKDKRDYLQHRKTSNWLYMSRLAALKEFAFMKALYQEGFPTPTPLDCNRHSILMTLIDGYPLYQIQEMTNPAACMKQCLDILVRLAEYGLVHGDFNEFNLLIKVEDESVVMIDFPQMISTSHLNAAEQFKRDVDCIHIFFAKRFGIQSDYRPDLQDIVRTQSLDVQVEASGFSKKHQQDLDELVKQQEQENPSEDGDESPERPAGDGQASDDDGEQEDGDDEEEEEVDDDDGADGQDGAPRDEEVANAAAAVGLKADDLEQMRREFEDLMTKEDGPAAAKQDADETRSFVSTSSYRRRMLSQEEIKLRVKRELGKKGAPSVAKLARRNTQKGKEKTKAKNEIRSAQSNLWG